jgi:phosphoribosylanthranilate isomerase
VAEISAKLKTNIQKVAVTVDETDAEIEQIIAALNPSYIQLHGAETPHRATEIKQKFGLKIIKAIGVEYAEDLQKAAEFINIADYILFDAKPPKNSQNPGGNAISFDWNIIKNANINYPFILAGGLTVENVAEAIKITNAKFVDVVSGVEESKGVKDFNKITDFIKNAKK